MGVSGIAVADVKTISVSTTHVLRLAQMAPGRVRRLMLATPFAAPMLQPGDPLFDSGRPGGSPLRKRRRTM